MADVGNCFFRDLAVLLETIRYYFVFRYLIADADQCYAVLSTITKFVDIQRVLTPLIIIVGFRAVY
jgi:hypothetical protein